MIFPSHEDIDIEDALWDVVTSIKEDIADSLGISSFVVDSCRRDGELAIYVDNPLGDEQILEPTKMSEIIKHGVLNLINEDALREFKGGT